MTYQEIIDEIYRLQNPEKVRFKEKKFGVKTQNALGIYMSDLNTLARRIGKNHDMGLKLFDSGIYEAKILCSKICKPKELNEEQVEHWVSTFDNWEICDSFCMGLVAKSRLAIPKILEWSSREKEFEKRASFATLAAYTMADKKAENEKFLSFFPLILNASDDNRLYVKKAVSWALRSIGKRNQDLQKEAIVLAKTLCQSNHPSAIWIAKDVLKELTKKDVRISDYPRAIYRK